MKIDPARIAKLMNNYSFQQNKKSDKLNQAKKKDGFSLSGKAKQLQNVKDKIDYSPLMRKEQVNQLKQQVKQGTYNVNGEEVAEKMLDQVISRKV